MQTITNASRQWANRPADEVFQSLADLFNFTKSRSDNSYVAKVPRGYLSTASVNGEVVLARQDNGARLALSHWTFGQVARLARAPAGYLATLPSDLASQCVNDGLRRAHDEVPADSEYQVLVKRNGQSIARAITSDRYARIHDHEVVARLQDLEANYGWSPAPASFPRADGVVSRGLYASDRDLFAFLVDNNRRIFEHAPGGGLSRGLLVTNSEVGASTFDVLAFLYQYICGNHIIWGARKVAEVKVRHVGDFARGKAFGSFQAAVTLYQHASPQDEERAIARALQVNLGSTADEALEAIFGQYARASKGLTKTAAVEGLKRAELHAADWYGTSPYSGWGVVSGITEYARDLVHQDARTEVDRAAGRLFEAFSN